jgi:hypothetical protein
MISSGGIVLEAHDETDLLCGPSAEQGIVVIAPISEEEFRVVKINNAISETSRAVCHLVLLFLHAGCLTGMALSVGQPQQKSPRRPRSKPAPELKNSRWVSLFSPMNPGYARNNEDWIMIE